MSRPLIVALHGVGSSAQDMTAALAPLEETVDIVALDGPEPFVGGGRGRQWFSIDGVTETNRPGRVVAALPPLIARLDILAHDRAIAPEDMILLGFSQGAIMTLALVAQGSHRGLAIAIAGRLAAPIALTADRPASVLLIHDRDDRVMPCGLSSDAARALTAAGHRVALKRTEGIGHSVGSPTLLAIADWIGASKSTSIVQDITQGQSL